MRYVSLKNDNKNAKGEFYLTDARNWRGRTDVKPPLTWPMRPICVT
jgi:hypothetical protein